MDKPISDIRKVLEQAQQNVEEAKKEDQRLAGRQEELLNRLKTERGLNSIAEAQTKITELEETAKEAEEFVRERFATLAETYGW